MKITPINNSTMPLQNPAVKKAAPAPAPPPKCIVVEQPDGAMQVSFLIEPHDADRLRRKANGVPLDRYAWDNLLYPSVQGFLY